MKKFFGIMTAFLALSQLAIASGDYSKKPAKKAAKKAAGKATFMVNTGSSKLNWTGKKITGSHTGHLKISNGTLLFDGSDLVGGSFDVDMTTITVTDLSGEWKDKLEGHLKTDDFFSTDKHKKASLKIKDVQFGKGGHYDVFGDLTIKGVTKPVNFRANVTNSGSSATASAKITFDRTDYGIRYKSGKSFGDKMIYDKVELDVKLVANKK